MRGTDFRSPGVGIALIVAKKFESKVDLQQGLGRVGRYKDPCKRFAIGKDEIDLVDIAAVQRLHDLMYKLITKLRPVKKINEATKNKDKSNLKKEGKEKQQDLFKCKQSKDDSEQKFKNPSEQHISPAQVSLNSYFT